MTAPLHALPRHALRCPVCGFYFSQTIDLVPCVTDTCSPTCAVTLEKYAQDRDLDIDVAAKEFGNG